MNRDSPDWYTDEELLGHLLALDNDDLEAELRYTWHRAGMSTIRLEFLCLMARVRRGGDIEHPLERLIRLHREGKLTIAGFSALTAAA